MQLILTHEYADFDAVASQLAASKLFPQMVPLLSRRINRNVHEFLTLYWDAFRFMRPTEWQRQPIERVLLVDTQTLTSVRGMKKELQVAVIDHHTLHSPQENWRYEVEPVGATVTLLVEKLRSANIPITTEEATLLLLGIYEDTGSLSYDTTTARDGYAAAWLLQQGAVLAVVRRFLQVALTQDQIQLLNDLQTAAIHLTVNGQSIMIAAAVAPEQFADELSTLAHHLRQILQPDGLFLLVQIGENVQLVARSAVREVDVSVVATALGGGGHARAAAALLKSETLPMAVQRVRSLLADAVQPRPAVSQIMSHGVQTIRENSDVAGAAQLMQRFGHEGFPVVNENNQVVGLLTRRAVDRALGHELTHLSVRQIMKEGAITITPDSSIDDLQELMLTEGWGQIPVVGRGATPDNVPIGIVTRTDLLNYLFQPDASANVPTLRKRLLNQLSPPLWQMVVTISKTAANLSLPLYFVGGLVRDLLLDKSPTDLDMVVEGNAIRLAQALQQEFGGEIRTHRRFGTAKWLLSGDVWHAVAAPITLHTLPLSEIDFVTARTEFYTEPTALPEVEQASIKLDLHRRDFTINTLAIRLDGQYLGKLLDFYGGQRDLEKGIIRVLHSLSFIDDPTRILRAVRIEQRLHFRIAPRTANLIAEALPLLERISGDRIRHEFELAFRENAPVPVMARLQELDVLRRIHPRLTWTAETAVTFQRLPDYLAQPAWLATLADDSPAFAYFALWMLDLPEAVQTAVMSRLAVRKTTRQDVKACRDILTQLAELPEDAPPSVISTCLRAWPLRVLLVCQVKTTVSRINDWIDQYFNEWRFVKTAVSGHDLREWGLPPGPAYSYILDKLLAARLDGTIHTEAEERELMARLALESKAD